MSQYVIRRLLAMPGFMVLISIVAFAVIQAQPGDFGSQYFSNPRVSYETALQMRAQLGLDQPAWKQYLIWVKGIVTRGDFGYSFAYKRPVADLIWERLAWTVVVSGASLLFSWVVAIPIGIYSAVRKYSFLDYALTFLGFIGLSIPNFFLALVLMYLLLQAGATSVGGLFSPEMVGAPWSWAKVVDLAKHLWVPVVAIGTSGTASLLRLMRANLLDVLQMPYVMTARSKGLAERVVIWKHAVRNAINPLVSLLGMQLPELLSGTIVTAIVLNLPTMGPFFYDALINQDQYLVMTFLMMSALLMLLGNLLADILLVWVDPTIRYD